MSDSVKVGCNELFNQLVNVSANSIVFVITLLNYFNIDVELEKNPLTNAFLILIICNGILIVHALLQIGVIFLLWNCELSSEEYDEKKSISALWQVIFSLTGLLYYGIIMYMAKKFIPFKNSNCHGYNIQLCSIGRFEGFMGIVLTILIVISIITIITIVCLKTKMSQKSTISSYLPFFKSISFLQSECPICLLDDSNKKIVKTICDHEFHEDCINNYIESKRTETVIPCPICRQNIKNLNIV